MRQLVREEGRAPAGGRRILPAREGDVLAEHERSRVYRVRRPGRVIVVVNPDAREVAPEARLEEGAYA